MKLEPQTLDSGYTSIDNDTDGQHLRVYATDTSKFE